MSRLALTLFGSFRVLLDDAPLANFHSARVQALLAYLALEAQRPHTREALATLFWPDEPDATAKQNLRQALYQLRQRLGESAQADTQTVPFLLISRETVQWNAASSHTLDVTAFTTHLAHRQLEAALALYQGELLAECASGSDRFEEWLLLRREQLHLQALDACAQLTQQALANHDYAQAQTYARRQLALEPWREEAHRQLMQALAESGNRGAALAQYETCQRILAEELGVKPDAITQVLAEQIRAGTASKALKPCCCAKPGMDGLGRGA